MIVVLAPLYEVPTALSSEVAHRFVNYLEDKQLGYVPLFSFFANGYSLTTALQSYPVEFATYFGHGTPDALVGQELSQRMLNPQNIDMLKDRVIYAFACQSGLHLGPMAVEFGVKAYFGSIDFMFGAFPEDEHDYFSDWADTITVIPRLLLEGETTGKALARFKARCSNYIDTYQDMFKSGKWVNGDWYAEAFARNRDGMQLYGDTQYKLPLIEEGVYHNPLWIMLNLILRSLLPR